MKTLITFSLACVCFTGGALAQTPKPDTTKPTAHTEHSEHADHALPTDASFARTMAGGGMAEVELAKLASDKASNSEVKKFASEMVKDHSANNDKLKSLAEQKGIKLPSNMNKEHAAAKSKLESLDGAQFDAQFMRAMVKDHERTVHLLQHQIDNGNDAAYKSFAKETLPTVQHHLEMARKVQGQLNDKSARDSTSYKK